MTALVVEHSLGLAQLQDAGRFGVRHLGVTQGGALDWVAMRWANWLLGNRPDSCVLEIPLGGLTLRCDADTSLAVCGADLAATRDGRPLPLWESAFLRAGERLCFDPPRRGVRAYLAVPGGFDAPLVMGSRSTVGREGLGGPDGRGRAVQTGDRLGFSPVRCPPRSVPLPWRGVTLPPLSGDCRLGVVLGAQYSGFSPGALFRAFNEAWTVDARSDRMGVRLAGPALNYTGPGLISEGVPLGAIQVPPDGQPIILLNDRQTIGGYPRLGALTPLACARLAQCPAGAALRLVPTGTDRARDELLALLQRADGR